MTEISANTTSEDELTRDATAAAMRTLALGSKVVDPTGYEKMSHTLPSLIEQSESGDQTGSFCLAAIACT